MRLDLRRVIIFTPEVERLAAFYRDIIGLRVLNSEDGWIEFAAGGCNLALHQGKSSAGTRPPKLVFYADDVAAARALLVKRGAADMGKLTSSTTFDMCDGKDPDGNPFQLSSRK